MRSVHIKRMKGGKIVYDFTFAYDEVCARIKQDLLDYKDIGIESFDYVWPNSVVCMVIPWLTMQGIKFVVSNDPAWSNYTDEVKLQVFTSDPK
ncbi:hypothetical protein MA9V1_108 [Chryseobacterium phage MA9V-1]|nr:hypothetical protein MA9V1_108 [Chryseobacterium phage MA9V-1]